MAYPILNPAQKVVLSCAFALFVTTILFVRWEMPGIQAPYSFKAGDITYEIGACEDTVCLTAPLWSGPAGYTIQSAPLAAKWVAILVIAGALLFVFTSRRKNTNAESFCLSFSKGLVSGILLTVLVLLVLGAVALFRWVF
jgi:hypothetical protein